MMKYLSLIDLWKKAFFQYDFYFGMTFYLIKPKETGSTIVYSCDTSTIADK